MLLVVPLLSPPALSTMVPIEPISQFARTVGAASAGPANPTDTAAATTEAAASRMVLRTVGLRPRR
jgi:hypothetical protein